MYRPKQFEGCRVTVSRELVRAYPFVTWVMNTVVGGVTANHVKLNRNHVARNRAGIREGLRQRSVGRDAELADFMVRQLESKP